MTFIKRILLCLMPLLAVLYSCEKEGIVFDYERPQFGLRSDAILLEVAMPQGTAADDEIFITGNFNGGIEEAIKNPKWQLEKASDNDIKWGIYLFPSDFKDGKTLADGFTFVSKFQGLERTRKGEPVLHTSGNSIGTRTDITVQRWQSYFEKPDTTGTPEHDGYTIYVTDNSGWDALAIYAWSDNNPELFGVWPGAQPTGSVTIKGHTFKYFDTGKDNEGLTYNLIFNDNNGGKQIDGPQSFKIDRDIYIELTTDGWKEINPDHLIEHDGWAIFIEDNSGWNETAMYAWGNDMPELFGAWPGARPTGTAVINGVTYKYYDTGESNKGLTYNLIMNNNNGGVQFDLKAVTLDRNYYFSITEKGGTEVDPYAEN